MNNNVGLFKRLLINFYDVILLFAVLYFFTIPIILFTQGNAVLNSYLYQLYLILIVFFYYAWFWKKYNQTLGMKIWKVKIYSRCSLDISYLQSLIRIITALAGGHLMLIFKSESLQDKLSKTYLERID
ncbi:MAG: RDD family protein [Gammaproteobacteria bacterium]